MALVLPTLIAKSVQELICVVVNKLPDIIEAWKGGGKKKREGEREILEALQRIEKQQQQKAEELDRVVENQAQMNNTLQLLVALLIGLNDSPNGEGEQSEVLQSLRSQIRDVLTQVHTATEEHQQIFRGEKECPGLNDANPDIKYKEVRAPTCGICTETYDRSERKPLIVSHCGHTFCKSCLEIVNRKKIFKCPTCRQSNDRLEDLLPNFALLNLMDMNEEDSGKGEFKQDSDSDETDSETEEVCKPTRVKKGGWIKRKEPEDLDLARAISVSLPIEGEKTEFAWTWATNETDSDSDESERVEKKGWIKRKEQEDLDLARAISASMITEEESRKVELKRDSDTEKPDSETEGEQIRIKNRGRIKKKEQEDIDLARALSLSLSIGDDKPKDCEEREAEDWLITAEGRYCDFDNKRENLTDEVHDGYIDLGEEKKRKEAWKKIKEQEDLDIATALSLSMCEMGQDSQGGSN